MRSKRPWRKSGKRAKPTDNEKKKREGEPIPLKLSEACARLQEIFANSPLLVTRQIRSGPGSGLSILVVFLQGIIDADSVSKTVLEPLLKDHGLPLTRTNAVTLLTERLVTNAAVEQVDTVEDVVARLVSGRVILLPEGSRCALACDASSTPSRAITDPETEGVARGPREGFVENLEQNLSLLRRRLRTPHFRTELFIVGKYTKTRIMLVYIDGIINEDVLAEARSRLSRIGDRVDGILVSEAVAELIEDHPAALFPTINTTERPERVAASLLEGRFAILVEGSPFTMVAPTFFVEFLTTSDDYTERNFTVVLLRMIRLIALVTTLFLPSVYVTFVSFHPETIPTLLLLSIAVGRGGVPLTPIAEALLMEFAFEVLREAGLRLPRLGNAVSIVGVLVVGQAAVAAGVVSPILIIVVATTAIASFAIPNFTATNILRVLRFPILIMSGMFGAVGIAVSLILLTLHLVSLRSFGVPYLSPVVPFSLRETSKGLFKQPFWNRTARPAALQAKSPDRQTPGLMPAPPREGDDDGKRQDT